MICPCSERRVRQICQHQCLGCAVVNLTSMNHRAQIDRIAPQNIETTMAGPHPNPPGPVGDGKAWKMKHSGVLTMLTRGAKPNGTLSHELVEEVRLKFGYRSPRSIQDIWKRYKRTIMNGNGFRIHRAGTSGRKLKFPPA